MSLMRPGVIKQHKLKLCFSLSVIAYRNHGEGQEIEWLREEEEEENVGMCQKNCLFILLNDIRLQILKSEVECKIQACLFQQ